MLRIASPVRRASSFIVLMLLTLPFVAPLLPDEFPDSGDGLLNLYRIVALDHSIRSGELWPRFLPALHYGFGSPIFNYYGPLSIYGAELIHLFGADYPLAYRLAVMLYAAMGALGAFLLGRRIAGDSCGIVTALAFLYAPPIFDTNNRLGQFAAVMLLPWILWAFCRLASNHRRIDFLLVVCLFGALILLHNITVIYAGPVYDLPNLHTNPVPNPRIESLRDVHEFERSTGWLGAMSAKEFLPVWVEEIPDANRLSERFKQSDIIARLLPGKGLSIHSESWGATDADLVVTLSQSRTLEFEWFYMPGWEATIDGLRAETRPGHSHGLVLLDVPRGEHHIRLRRVLTPVQFYATITSFVTVFALLGFLWRGWRG